MVDPFKPAKIGNLEVPNRFVRSATGEGLADNGKVTEPLIELYRMLSNNNIGTIITGFSYVNKKGQSVANMLGFDNAELADGFKRLAGAVHEGDSKIVVQLVHAGARRFYDSREPLEGPSVVPGRMTQKRPYEMRIEDIKGMVADYASAAKLAVDSGFDAVQIHSAHEYLLSTFLSPHNNLRTDEYGGPIENRARALFEVYEAVREAIGPGVPILVKIDIIHFYDDECLTFEDSRWVCERLSEMGVDAIELSTSGGDEFFAMFIDITTSDREAYLAEYSKEVKKRVKCPVMLCGGIRSLEVIEKLYDEDVTDFISMSRPLIAESDLITRWKAGNTERAKCISCGKCMFAVIEGNPLKCYTFDGD